MLQIAWLCKIVALNFNIFAFRLVIHVICINGLQVLHVLWPWTFMRNSRDARYVGLACLSISLDYADSLYIIATEELLLYINSTSCAM